VGGFSKNKTKENPFENVLEFFNFSSNIFPKDETETAVNIIAQGWKYFHSLNKGRSSRK